MIRIARWRIIAAMIVTLAFGIAIGESVAPYHRPTVVQVRENEPGCRTMGNLVCGDR